MAQETAVNWLIEQLHQLANNPETKLQEWGEAFEQAKQMEKKQMVKFAEFVSSHPDKNKNYQGEMLHAKSKYDEAERTIDLLEQYYNETYSK